MGTKRLAGSYLEKSVTLALVLIMNNNVDIEKYGLYGQSKVICTIQSRKVAKNQQGNLQIITYYQNSYHIYI